MSATEALKVARAAGIKLGIDGNDLVLEASAPPPATVLDLLSCHKASIVAMLRPGGDVRSAQAETTEPTPLLLPSGECLHRFCADNVLAVSGEVEEERSAIFQHDGNIRLAWAEGLTRFDPDHPPGDVPLRRWQCFVDDVGSFLDSPFCAAAAALGWGPYDLFGCNREKPFARIDHAGLLWLLNGNKLVAVSENTATIEMTTGARQIWRRKPDQPGRVLAWELYGGLSSLESLHDGSS